MKKKKRRGNLDVREARVWTSKILHAGCQTFISTMATVITKTNNQTEELT